MLQKKNIIIVHATCLGACSFVRQHAFTVLAECGLAGEFEIVRSREPINDDYILAHTAAVWILRPFLEEHAAIIEHYRRRRGKHKFRIVADYDDLVWDIKGRNMIPPYNTQPVDTVKLGATIEKFAGVLDTVMLSTEWLRVCWLMRYGDACKDVQVVWNAVPGYIWGHNRRRVKKLPKRLKVLYGGSVCHHSGDEPGDFEPHWLEWLKRDNVEFHIFGTEVPKWLECRNIALHEPVASWVFPSTVREIEADLYIAPLQDNAFNRAKSNLKLLEASALGIPLLGSYWEKFCPYAEAAVRIPANADPDNITTQLRDPKVYNAVLDAQDAVMEAGGYWMESRPYRDRLLSALLGPLLTIEN